MTDQPTAVPAIEATARRRRPPKVRGVYEKVAGSGIWWVQFWDASGRRRREKARTRGMALALLDRRRDETRWGIKLPETVRKRPALFKEIAADCLEYSRGHKASHAEDAMRTAQLLPILGDMPAASITPQHCERALNQLADARGWKPATRNRAKALLSLCFRIAVQNGRLENSPVRAVRRKREDNAKIRWLTRRKKRGCAPRLKPAIPNSFRPSCSAAHRHEAVQTLLADSMGQGGF